MSPTAHMTTFNPQHMDFMDRLTLWTLWIFSGMCLILIIIRLAWRFRRGETFFSDDMWMAMSIGPLAMRVAFIHVTLVFMTSSFDHTTITPEILTTEDIRRRVIGSKVVLPGRVCYVAFIWCMKVCIVRFYERITLRERHYGMVLDFTYWLLGMTFVAVVLSTFLECRPIELYWQIFPDPGRCVLAESQLITMGSLNIATDILLICIPLPMVFKARLPLSRKIQLIVLFGVSFFVVAITMIRVPIIIHADSVQKARTLWASIECMTACIVANAPVIHSYLKKARHHHHSHDRSDNLRHSPGSRRRRRAMPVTGQDSLGSLTRGETYGASNMIETGTDTAQKVYIDRNEMISFTAPKQKPWPSRSPWSSEFLSTEIYTEYHGPAVPSPVYNPYSYNSNSNNGKQVSFLF